MSHRHILRTKTGSQQQVRGLLTSIFTAELMSPSPQLFLVSAWIRDFQVLDNRGGSFRGLDPTWGRRTFRLAEVLRILIQRGSDVVIATNPDRGNRDFLDRIKNSLGESEESRLRTLVLPQLHVKGLVGAGYAVIGSMNFTNNGVENNDELLTYETDPGKVAGLTVEFEQAYGGPA